MKKITLFATVFCAIFAIACGAAEKYGNAEVKADRLNVRLKPSVKSPRVGVLNGKDRLNIVEKDGAWYKVDAPPNLKVYVSAVYLIDGKLTNATHLRAGNSATAPSFGKLPAGTKLSAVGNSDRYGWIQVVPPAGVFIYAYSDYVKLDDVLEIEEKQPAAEAKKPAAEAKKPAAEVKKPAAEVKKPAAEAKKPAAEEKQPAAEVKKPAAEVKKPAIPSKQASAEKMKKITNDLNAMKAAAAEDITVTGVLCKIDNNTNAVTEYAVYDSKQKTGFFVCGISEDFCTANINKEITVTGKAYRIKNWKSVIILFGTPAAK